MTLSPEKWVPSVFVVSLDVSEGDEEAFWVVRGAFATLDGAQAFGIKITRLRKLVWKEFKVDPETPEIMAEWCAANVLISQLKVGA